MSIENVLSANSASCILTRFINRFSGFIVVGVFGGDLYNASIQEEEFGDCYEYFEDKPPVPIDCDAKLLNKSVISGITLGLVAIGVLALIKGVRGSWDKKVKPEDMVGPGGENPDKSDSNESSQD